MSEPLLGVVVTHRALGTALVEAVRCITGDSEPFIAVSNDGCARDALMARIQEAVDGKPCVLFVDLPGGSCYQAAAHLEHTSEGMKVVAGVNLAMLLDFAYHRDCTPEEAAARAVQTGVRAIQRLRS
jgi:mannose/fructose-specific phosphotransferase system component IIA